MTMKHLTTSRLMTHRGPLLSRRSVIAGLAALGVPSLSGCAGRQQPSGFVASTPAPTVSYGPALDAVIDMNHFSVVSDFSTIRNRGNILAIIHKASEGGDWVDPLYRARCVQAQNAGLLWGAYHFGTGQYSGAQQAAFFLASVQPTPTTRLALDLEPNDRNPGNTMSLLQAEDFVQTIYNATGRLPLIYTHPTWANGGSYGRTGLRLNFPVTSQSILAACDLWLADYRGDPVTPQAWAGKGWRLWQYAGDNSHGGGGALADQSRAVQGVNLCDRNLFRGNPPELIGFWTGVPSKA